MRKTLCLVAFLAALIIQDARGEHTKFVGVALTPPRMGTWGVVKDLGVVVVQPTLCSRAGGESGTGTLLSKPFFLKAPKVRIAVRGWSGFPDKPHDRNRLELIDAATGKVLRTTQPPRNTETAKWLEWNVEDLTDRQVRLRLIDGDDGNAYAWFAVDAIDAGDAFRVSFAQSPSLDEWELVGGVVDLKSQVAVHFGVPFLAAGEAMIPNGRSVEIPIGIQARRLFLFGMTHSIDHGTPLWWYPTDYSIRYWVGDKLGDVQLNYEDGTSETYPLILGDAMWWGDIFHKFPEPFLSKSKKMQTLRQSLRLFPADPVSDSTRLAFIRPQPKPIRSISLIDRPEKGGVPRIRALTVEVSPGQKTDPETTTILPRAKPTDALAAFLANEANAMQPEGANEDERKARLKKICNALYTTEENFPKNVKVDIPEGYRGPKVKFEGTIGAEVLTNVFLHNLHEMDEKADASGIFRESTKNSASFGGYVGFGTYKTGHAPYWNDAWSRGVGRELQLIAAFGYYDKMLVCIDYCFRQARLWDDPDNDALKIDGHAIPPHWCRNIARPVVGKHLGVFENDGHGLIMLAVYNAWRRLPNANRNTWLRERWEDVNLAAEWILWQFENPEISGATENVLLTDSECVYNNGFGLSYGHSLYADYPCMQGLLIFAKMADSIGKKESAARWRERAEKMRVGIEKHYIVGGTEKDKPKVWKLWDSGWAHQSANLAPTAFLSDTEGFTPEVGNPDWKPINEATYQRLIDKWSGKGIEGDPWWFEKHEMPIRSRPHQYTPQKGNFGIAMGYGQGFIAQTALLLDRTQDATDMLRWTARLVYYADYKSYIVPEGAETHPDGKMWYRTGDLGNGQQQADTMKALRLVIGVDDTDPGLLRLFPRMPRDWSKITVSEFPAWIDVDGDRQRVSLDFILLREKDGMQLNLKADRPLGNVEVRLGPFDTLPKEPQVHCNGLLLDAQRETSGDSTWVRVKVPAGLPTFILKAQGKIH